MKTQTPEPIAQQLNREGRVDESLLRQSADPFVVLAVPVAQAVHIAAMYLPGLSDVLELQPISFKQWAALLCVALVLFAVEELHKAWMRRCAYQELHP